MLLADELSCTAACCHQLCTVVLPGTAECPLLAAFLPAAGSITLRGSLLKAKHVSLQVQKQLPYCFNNGATLTAQQHHTPVWRPVPTCVASGSMNLMKLGKVADTATESLVL